MNGYKTRKHKDKLSTRDMTLIAMFTAILAICSWIYIPTTIPFTLQNFGVFLAAGVLGGKRGSLAVFIYILLGIMGVPVFAGFTGGAGMLFGNTGGYIIGFLLSALTMWLMEVLLGKKKMILLLSMVCGLLVCYLFGTIWFIQVYSMNTGAIGIGGALAMCVIPFIIPDCIKIGLAFVLSMSLKRSLRKSKPSSIKYLRSCSEAVKAPLN